MASSDGLTRDLVSCLPLQAGTMHCRALLTMNSNTRWARPTAFPRFKALESTN